jgi:Raf kinase inhibitor-like YbhB/YbcL family protein
MLYTCDSTNISPPLNWTNEFNNTGSFAIIMDDPDAPMGTWVHWIIYNIPGSALSLAAHFPMDSVLADGSKQGFTSFRTTGYGGPCPPEGVHRYFFKLYALDAKLNVPARLTKSQLLEAMKGHIQGETELMGRYFRRKKN